MVYLISTWILYKKPHWISSWNRCIEGLSNYIIVYTRIYSLVIQAAGLAGIADIALIVDIASLPAIAGLVDITSIVGEACVAGIVGHVGIAGLVGIDSLVKLLVSCAWTSWFSLTRTSCAADKSWDLLISCT
jgi:hypothetical protein